MPAAAEGDSGEGTRASNVQVSGCAAAAAAAAATAAADFDLLSHRKANTHADNLLLFEARAAARGGGAKGPVLSARGNLEGVGKQTGLGVVERRHALSARGGDGLEEEILLSRAKKLCMVASGLWGQILLRVLCFEYLY